MTDLTKRIGELLMSGTLIRDNADMVALMLSGSVVVRAELYWKRDEMHYVLMHPAFDVIDGDEPVPHYVVTVTVSQGDVPPTFAWHRLAEGPRH